MSFLSMLTFPFFLVPVLSLKALDSNIDSSGLISGKDCAVVGPNGSLHVLNDYVAPDGYNRSATLVNGVFPAPLIKARKGDEFNIKLVNILTDDTMPLETSVHFHGIFQRKSNWADGTAYVTQCPLRQNESFVHKFSTTGQTGTYWYHSHYKAQYCDGLRGPLVIYDPDDPLKDWYDVDDETTVITLADWYHDTSSQVDRVFPAPREDSTLINGKGRYPGGPLAPLSVINVRQKSRYRLRVVSTACNALFNFSIDGHRMTIIEVEGNEVSPVPVDSIPIYPGQRYSVVITANQSADNYWIRALRDSDSSVTNSQNLAILRYEGAPVEDPTSSPGPCEIPFDEGKLHPLLNPGAPGKPEIGQADVNLVLAPGNTSDRFTLNNVSYVDYPVPVLLQILSGKRSAWELMPKGSVYPLPLNKVVEISFPYPDNATDGAHPIHLHGHAFDVVRVAGSNVTNFVNPVRRDVVSIGATTDNVTIRFVTDNPGPWFLHCHIEWHLFHGFAVVMAEAPDEAAYEESIVAPSDWYDLCAPGKNWGQQA